MQRSFPAAALLKCIFFSLPFCSPQLLLLMCQNGGKNPQVTFQNIFVMLHQLVLAWLKKCTNQCENAKIQVLTSFTAAAAHHKTFQLKSLMKDFALLLYALHCWLLQMAWQKVVLVVYDNAFKPLCNAQWNQNHLKTEYIPLKSLIESVQQAFHFLKDSIDLINSKLCLTLIPVHYKC